MSKFKTVVRDVVAGLVTAALAYLIDHYVSVELAWLTLIFGGLVLLWLHELHRPIGIWLLLFWVNHKPLSILGCVVVVAALFAAGIAISRFRLPPDPKPLTYAHPPKIDFPPTVVPIPPKPEEPTASQKKAKIAEPEEDRDGARIVVTVGPSPEPNYAYQTRFILTNNNHHRITETAYICEPPKTDMNKVLPGLRVPVTGQDLITGLIGNLRSGDSFSINCEAPAAFWLNSVESPVLKIWIGYKYGGKAMKRGFTFLGLRNPNDKTYSWVPRGEAAVP